MDLYNKKHEHRWIFLTTKGSYEALENGLYKFTDYAIMICNGCQTVLKQRIKSNAEVEAEDAERK